MRRRIILTLVTIAVGVAAFIGVSHASGAAPTNLPSNLPASQLPTVALSSDFAAQISQLVAPFAAGRYGITSASYKSARKLADTTAGPLYVIPATNGECVVLLPAISCGDAVADGVLSVYVGDSNGNAVGGGIIGPGVRVASLESGSTAIIPTSVPGGFVLPSSAHVAAPMAGGVPFSLSLDTQP